MDPDDRAGHDLEGPIQRAAHDHVTDVLRAHRHLTVAPRRLRDWYQSTDLTRLPEAAGPD